MLRSVPFILCLVVSGCANQPEDEVDFERLPIAALSEETSGGLPPCGDTALRAGDTLARLPDGSGTVVLIRDGEPICAEDFATWLSAELLTPDGDEEAPSSGGEMSTAAPDSSNHDDDGDPMRGPRPIPWKDGSDDSKTSDDK